MTRSPNFFDRKTNRPHLYQQMGSILEERRSAKAAADQACVEDGWIVVDIRRMRSDLIRMSVGASVRKMRG